MIGPRQPAGKNRNAREEVSVPEREIDWYGRRLRAIRQQRGLSQGDLGRRVHLPAGQIDQFETNAGKPSLATALALAEALGVPITEFVSPHSGGEAAADARGRRGAGQKPGRRKPPPRLSRGKPRRPRGGKGK
jgi:transcriptional regulator with XRE-family HTH domain